MYCAVFLYIVRLKIKGEKIAIVYTAEQIQY